MSSMVGSYAREPAVSSTEVAAIVEVTTETQPSPASAPKSSIEDLMRYSLKKDDPLPASVESKILRSESLLKEVTEKL
jgi:hypothetical protein